MRGGVAESFAQRGADDLAQNFGGMLDPDFALRSSLFLFYKKWGFGDALVSVLKNDFLTCRWPFSYSRQRSEQ